MRAALRLPGHLALGACLLLGCPTTGRAQSDWGSWLSGAVKAVDTPKVDVSAFVQLRLHDARTELRQVYLSGLIAIDAADHLGLAANYTYLPTRSAATGHYLYQHRIELEATPRWRPAPRWRLDLRDRLELRWLEGRQDVNQRSRHRAQAVAAVAPGLGVTAVFTNNEFFYDWDHRASSENRLTPAGVRFGLAGGGEFDLYYMVQSTRRAALWSHTHLLGTHVSVSW